jgi:mannosyltransferase
MLSTLSSPQIKTVVLLETKEASWLRDLVVLTPIVLVYLILALYRIDYQSFWGDELASIQSAAPGESFLTGTHWVSGHGPLYFALLHLWIKAGQSEYAIRSLSAFIGVAAICLIYATGLRLFDRKVAVISATLLATSPFFIWYSQEARYVTLAISTSLLSIYTFHQALSSGSSRSWLIYALATTAALLAFITNGFVAVAQGLYLLASRRQRPMLRKWLACQVAIGIVFATWFLISYGRLSIVTVPEVNSMDVELDPISLQTGTPRELSAAVIPYTFYAFSAGFSMGPSVRELHISRDLVTLLDDLPTILPLLLLFGALFAFGIVRLWPASEAPGIVLLWLLIPISTVLIVAATTDVAYNVRYACAALPAYIFVLAIAIVSFRKRAVQLTILATVFFVNSVSLAHHYFNPSYAKPDAREAARYLQGTVRPTDVILVVGSTSELRHYYKGNLPIVSWDRAAAGTREAVRKRLRELTKDHDRLWLVAIRPWETDPEGNVKSSLDELLQITHNMDFAGADITCYLARKDF